MTKYRCNKDFKAHQIMELNYVSIKTYGDLTSIILCEMHLYNGDSKEVSEAWIDRHLVEPDDYLLVDENDRVTYCSKEDFEKYYSVDEDSVLLPRKLTAENGAEGVMSGEFKENVIMNCENCDGDGFTSEFSADETCECCTGSGDYSLGVTIGWDTIKEIYERVVSHFDVKTNDN